jgi:hypothetical protein
MSWWNRRKPESIWCTPEGLCQLVDDINTDVGMSEVVHGPAIRVRPGMSEDSKDLLYVTLEPYLIDRLRRRVKSYEFSDVYGPRARTRTGGAPDGTS